MLRFWEAPEEQKKEIKQRVYQLSKQLSSIKVASRIRDEYAVEISDRYIRNLLADIKQNIDEVWETLTSAIEAVNEDEDKKQYSVEEIKWELHYILETKEEKFVIPVAQIDRMFKDFSRKGNNLSGEWMRQKYKLKPQAWNAIKTKLQLYKDSHVVSPYTLENLSEEDEGRVIEKAISDHIDTKVDKFTNTYEREFKKRAEQALKEKANFEYRLEKLREVLATYKPEKIDFVPNYVPNGSEAHFFLTDIHIGKIDTDGIKRRLKQMYQDIIASESNTIHITCLWDLVETMAENGMHKNQIAYGTEQKYWYGFELAMNTTSIFAEWLTAIAKSWKKIYFKWLPWNHDRLTEKNDEDVFRSGWLFIYEMLRLRVEQLWIEVEYFKEDINVFIADGIQYIVGHWEWPMGRQKPEQIIVEYAKVWVYTILASGHTHALQMSEGKNYTRLVIPALAGKGVYDKKLNLHSEPWYLRIDRNAYYTADITIKRLK